MGRNAVGEEVKVISTIDTIERSDTQCIKVQIVEVRGKRKIATQKYWRKEAKGEWLPGKGFHTDFEETQLINLAYEKALESIE